jgi:hypothetical protein
MLRRKQRKPIKSTPNHRLSSVTYRVWPSTILTKANDMSATPAVPSTLWDLTGSQTLEATIPLPRRRSSLLIGAVLLKEWRSGVT